MYVFKVLILYIMSHVSRHFAFTLIEIVIVVTIVAFLSVVTYVPYQHYNSKAKIRHTEKEISQLLYDARNMAINGVVLDGINDSNTAIWVFFNSSLSKIQLYQFPHELEIYEMHVNMSTSHGILLQEVTLQPGVQIDSIAWSDRWMLLFQAISWEGSYHYIDTDGNHWTDITDTEIEIIFSFWWAVYPWPLSSKIIYMTDTNIVDY